MHLKAIEGTGVNDLRKALDDIGSIRQQMVAGTLFRGLGPAVVALSGLLALATAAVQSAWGRAVDPTAVDPLAFFAVWVALALVSAGLIGFEMRARTYRHHVGLADAMIVNAVEHFLPAGIAGGAIAVALLRYAPDAVWMLPGLWQILVSIGLFASQRFLPRTVVIAAAWYFLAGITVLVLSAETRTLSPWAMGVPFGFGQLLLAALLHIAFGNDHDEIQ